MRRHVARSSSAAGKPLILHADSGILWGIPAVTHGVVLHRDEEGARKLGEPKEGPMQVQPSASGASRITSGAER
jgi:hypothetical protein